MKLYKYHDVSFNSKKFNIHNSFNTSRMSFNDFQADIYKVKDTL